MSIVVNLAIFPMDKKDHLSPYVARSLRVIEASGLPYQLGPMGMAIEGGYDEVMAVVRDCFTAMAADCDRVYLSLSMDYRKDGEGRIQGKVGSVEQLLGNDLSLTHAGQKPKG
ncbi:MAG: MTH1187 family thiamine-binding protein [Desulfovibrionaceae bacterium]